MLQKYVVNLAAQMKMQLSQLSVIVGRDVESLDTRLLNLTFNGQQQSSYVYQSELAKIQTGESCDQLELRIRFALSQLQMKMSNEG